MDKANEILEYVYAATYECEKEINNTHDWNEIAFWKGKQKAYEELLEMFAPDGKEIEA